jgi:hypothetical protein
MTYKERRAAINRANALKSTGPNTPAGKQRSSLNACKHNLTGFRIILHPDEMQAYNELTETLTYDLDPQSGIEHQTVQKIIDAHFRLNRLASLENNIFQFGAANYTSDNPHDDLLETMIAQTSAWLERGSSFDILGRYESRLARQLLKFTLELERLQRARKLAGELHKNPESEALGDHLASFGKNAPQIVMTGTNLST